MARYFGASRNAGDGAGDDEVEMLRRDRLDARTADAVLDGRGGRPHGDELADLAAFVAAVRTQATSGSARPNASLTKALANGISADKGDLPVTAASNVNGPATQVSGPPKRRTRKMLETITASFAALGLAAKAGIAGAAVVATTAGAGAVGALPDTLQDSFDNVVRGAEQSDDVEPAEIDTPDDGVDGSQISEDAKDGGVEGAEVADDASEGRSTEGRDRAEDARENAPELPAQADEGLRPAAPDERPEAPVGPPTQGGNTEAPVETPAADGADTAPRAEGGR